MNFICEIKKSHKTRAQGGPRGGPLVVPPILGKILVNHMQSGTNDLIDIFTRGTMKPRLFELGLIVIKICKI